MTKLALVDIDGTLTDTVQVDYECFLRALKEAFDIDGDLTEEWEGVEHVTDAGAFQHIFHRQMSRNPRADEADHFVAVFIGLLEQEAARSPGRFAEIPGAREWLAALRSRPEWEVAVATGCYRESAELKLRAARLTADKSRMATASDRVSREAIFRLAIDRTTGQLGREFESVVLVGDGVWDARTARALGIPFIGVAKGDQADRLISMGAVEVIPDYLDTNASIEILSSAANR